MLPWPIFQPMVLANFITGGNTIEHLAEQVAAGDGLQRSLGAP
jgi:hypothetical protein